MQGRVVGEGTYVGVLCVRKLASEYEIYLPGIKIIDKILE